MKFIKLSFIFFIFSFFLVFNKVEASRGDFDAKAQVPESLSTGVVIAKSDGEIIDCTKAPLWDRRLNGSGNNGIGILILNKKNVTVKNCDVSGFYFGLFADNATGLTIENSSFYSNNVVTKDFYPNSFSKEADISKNITEGEIITFINKTIHQPLINFPNASDDRKWEKGGGIIIQNSDNISVKNTLAQYNFIGVGLFNVSNSEISDNNLSYNPGFGIFLYNATHNTIDNNNLSHSNNLAEWIRKPGIDNAALMLIHGSSYNKITNNNMDYSADGLFLTAAEAPPYPTSDYNYIAGNSARYSPHNAFEVVFSYGNILENNDASYSNYGFWATYGEGLKIINNKIIGNISAGIAIRQGLNYEITGNVIQDSGWYEITGKKRSAPHPDGFGVLIITDEAHNWKPVFPANKNITIKDNQFISNQKAIGIDGDFEIDGTPESNYLKNSNIVSRILNFFFSVETTTKNGYINTFKDNKKNINYGPDYKLVNTNAEATPSCEILSKGTALNPYVITFISTGFSDISEVRDNFIPSCTGSIGNLNPSSAFPDITKNVPNLGIFSIEPFKSNKDKFIIQYINSLNASQNFGCQTNGTGCDYTAIKNRALSSCPNTNAIFLLKNDGYFGWTTNNGPDPFASSNIPLIALGVSSSKERIENEAWGVCAHEFGHAFGFLADEVGGEKNISQTGYNSAKVANCALPSECQAKFGKNSPCIAGCGFSDSLSRSRQNSIMAGNITASVPDSTTFNEPSLKRLSNLIKNADILKAPSFSGVAWNYFSNTEGPKTKSYFDPYQCYFSVDPIYNAEEYLFTIKMPVKNLIGSETDDVIEIYNSDLNENYQKNPQKNIVENCNFFENNLDINKTPLSVKRFLIKKGIKIEKNLKISLSNFLDLSDYYDEIPLTLTASVKVNGKWSRENEYNTSFLKEILRQPIIIFPQDKQKISLEDCYIEVISLPNAKKYHFSSSIIVWNSSSPVNIKYSSDSDPDYLKKDTEKNKTDKCALEENYDSLNKLAESYPDSILVISVNAEDNKGMESSSIIYVYIRPKAALPQSKIISPKEGSYFNLEDCQNFNIETTLIPEADTYIFSLSLGGKNIGGSYKSKNKTDFCFANILIINAISNSQSEIAFPVPLSIKVIAKKNGEAVSKESPPVTIYVNNPESNLLITYPKDGQVFNLNDLENCYIEATTTISDSKIELFSFDAFPDPNIFIDGAPIHYSENTEKNRTNSCFYSFALDYLKDILFKNTPSSSIPFYINVYASTDRGKTIKSSITTYINNSNNVNDYSTSTPNISNNDNLISTTTPSAKTIRPLNISSSNSTPIFTYPKEGDNLTLGEIFKFSIAPVKNATAFRFFIYQNNKLIYEGEQSIDSIAKGEKFNLKTYYNLVPGILEIRASAKVDGVWSPEAKIKVNLINKQKSELKNSFNQKLAGSLPTLYQLLNPLFFFLK